MKQYKFLFPYIRKVKNNFLQLIFIILVSAILVLIPPYLLKILLDKGVYNKDVKLIVVLSIILVFIYLCNFFLRYFIGSILTRTSSNLIAEIKKDLFSKVFELPLKYFDDKQNGYIMERIKEIDSINNLFSPMFTQFFISCLSFFGAVSVVACMGWELLVCALLFVPMFWKLTNYASKKLKSTSVALLEANAKASGKMQENLGGIAEVKSLSMEYLKIREIKNEISEVALCNIARGKALTLGSEGVQALTNISSVIVMLVAGLMIIGNKVSIGDYIAVSQYALIIFNPVQLLSNYNIIIQPALVSLKRIKDIFDESSEKSSGAELNKEISSIKFERVTFAYSDHKNILNELSFEIEEGDKVAIVGANGSGKSTITKLILGLYDQYEGMILINGIDLRELSKRSVREKMGIVSQNIFLFAGTLKENILLSNSTLSDSEISKCLMDSGWLNVDLEWRIEEGGKNLSGGQKQKIAIARMLAKKADVLIFDEATANLDVETKEVIEIAIKTVLASKTCIFISHDKDVNNYANRYIEL